MIKRGAPRRRPRPRPSAKHPLRQVLAANLVAIREQRKMTQEELSARSDVCRATIVLLEGADGDPMLSTLCALARALGCQVAALLAARA